MKKVDVLIIGAGPAGSTAATILARAGHSVHVLEASQFPRYHIGESLLPSAIEFFKILGVYEKVKSHGFTPKQGAYFMWGADPSPWSVQFGDLREDALTTFQVDRAEFDKLLIDHAQSEGATVEFGAKVSKVVMQGDAVSRVEYHVGDSSLQVKPRFMIDASGRAGIMATKVLNTRVYHGTFKNIAVWGYWKGAKSLPTGIEGAVTTAAYDKGWIWGIPLADGTFSVGVVSHVEEYAKRESREQFYHDAIARCPLIKDLLQTAELKTKLRFEKEFSYWSTRTAGENYFLAGDAAAFIDPILSSGIHLAMLSSLTAATCIKARLDGTMNADESQDYYEALFQQSFLRFVTFVSAFYNQNRFQDEYFSAAQDLTGQHSSADLRKAFLNLISGQQDLGDATGGFSFVVAQKMREKISENIAMRKDRSLLEKMSGTEQADASRSFFDSIEGVRQLSENVAGFRMELQSEPRLVRAGSRKLKLIA